MSMRDEGRHDPIDALIDATARSMTEGLPPISLRAAIRERIAAPRKGLPDVSWGGVSWSVGRPFTGRLALAGGAVAATVLLVVGVGRDEAPTTVRPAPPPVVAVGPPAEAAPRVTTLVPAQPPQRVQSAPERPAFPTPVGATADVTGDAEPIVIELVEVEPLRPDPLDMELMEIPMPLRAESVQIDPISIE
jgi:hypothetical protein